MDHPGPHFLSRLNLPRCSRCLQKPAPASTTTCQDVPCLSAPPTPQHTHTHKPQPPIPVSVCLVPHKHRCTCKHTLSCVLLRGQIRKTLSLWLHLCTCVCPLTLSLTHTSCVYSACVCTVKMLMAYLSWWPFLLSGCPVFCLVFFFYKYHADILGCVITALQQHGASLLVFWQWPSSSLPSVCVCFNLWEVIQLSCLHSWIPQYTNSLHAAAWLVSIYISF